MKTEAQITEKLEACVKKMAEVSSSVEDGDPTKEQLSSIMHMTGWLFCIGWVLDCEDELRQLMAPLKIAAAMETISGVVADTMAANKKKKGK